MVCCSWTASVFVCCWLYLQSRIQRLSTLRQKHNSTITPKHHSEVSDESFILLWLKANVRKRRMESHFSHLSRNGARCPTFLQSGHCIFLDVGQRCHQRNSRRSYPYPLESTGNYSACLRVLVYWLLRYYCTRMAKMSGDQEITPTSLQQSNWWGVSRNLCIFRNVLGLFAAAMHLSTEAIPAANPSTLFATGHSCCISRGGDVAAISRRNLYRWVYGVSFVVIGLNLLKCHLFTHTEYCYRELPIFLDGGRFVAKAELLCLPQSATNQRRLRLYFGNLGIA